MLKLVIIDDEESARFVIKHIVKSHCAGFEVVGEADSVETGVQLINKVHPDFVVLDIHLRDGSGFDLLRSLEVIRFKLIFVTAYEKYAVEAIKFSAISYFLKPVDPVEFSSTLNKLAFSGEGENTSLKLNAFFVNLIPDFINRKKIVLESESGIYLININDIIRCEAIGLQTKFFLKSNERIIINKPLKEYQLMLADHHFFKVSKSHLLNLHHFTMFDASGASNIITSDHCLLPYNPEKKNSLLQALQLV
jgi:two-component system LytT family response regulator